MSTISNNVARDVSSMSFSATHFTKCFTNVLGILPLTPYIDMWSPLYVAQPKASSERSPVPTTIPQVWLAISINICVRSRACEFSYTTSCTLISWSISLKCWMQASFMLTSRMVTPNDAIKSTALVWVRSVVPNPGIVTPIIPLRFQPSLSNVFTQTSNASVESRPPDMPTTALLALVCSKRCANPDTCMENISSQRSSNAAP